MLTDMRLYFNSKVTQLIALYVVCHVKWPLYVGCLRPQPKRTSWKLVGNWLSTCCKPGRFLHSTCAASCQPACRDRPRLPTCWQPQKLVGN